MFKWIAKMWRKFWDGVEHRRNLRRIKRDLEEGKDPFTY